MVKNNPCAYFNPEDGAFYKRGFSGDYEVITKIGEASQDYNTGGSLEAKEVKIPELMPEFRMLSYKGTVDDAEFTYDMGQFLYIGAYKSLNSKMVIAGKDKEETSEPASRRGPSPRTTCPTARIPASSTMRSITTARRASSNASTVTTTSCSATPCTT